MSTVAAGGRPGVPKHLDLLTDAIGLALLLLATADYLRPSLLLLPTVTAGGDTPCHYPTFVDFHQRLLPDLRLHGWAPGPYLGHPLLLYYFPFPFLLMSALAPMVGLPAAFKLGTALGVFALPLCAYASLRLMGFRAPAPLLGAAASYVFLLCEQNPIWGGTLASTLTGEFSYTYGIGLAMVFLGLVYRAYSRGSSPWLPALALAVTAFAHGYAVLWAGLSAAYFLYGSRRPLRTLTWLAAVAAIAFALVAFWLLPLLASWRWTTAYDDPWITISPLSLFPPLLWPLFGFAALGVLWTLVVERRRSGADHRLLFLGHAALVAAALACGGPALGIIDVRFVPFAHLALCLAGGATLGWAVQRLAARSLTALAVTLLAVAYGDARSQVARAWVDWNYTGLEAKELWPSFRALMRELEGGVTDPRVAVEYSKEHERAGSIRMYETLPLFSGRSTLEGVYNQASLMTHPVYYVASELGATSPNPFRKREYSTFDTEGALAHLRLFNTRDIVALSPQLVSSLEGRPGVTRTARIPPYTVFRYDEGATGYVTPMAFAPVRSSLHGWRENAYRWFTRKPFVPAHLVFTDDRQFPLAQADEWLPPPAVPLPGGVTVAERVEPEAITIETSRVGHPLLVKVSYHPRWRATGADGPYLVSPALMMVVPRQGTVRLHYGRDASDYAGMVVTALAAVLGVAMAVRARRRRTRPVAEPLRMPAWVRLAWGACDADDVPPSPRRWGGLVAGLLLVTLAAGRLLAAGDHRVDPRPLYELASRAYAEERWADAAEYARHALPGAAGTPLGTELLCLRGESLLRAGQPRLAAEAFQPVAFGEATPYQPRSLFGLVQAHRAAGDEDRARVARERLEREFGETPWADRLRKEEARRSPTPLPSRPASPGAPLR